MNNYSQMVQNLKASDYNKMADRLRDPVLFDILHALLGVASEAPELAAAKDEVNLKEELGDALFYCELGLCALGSSVEDVILQYGLGQWKPLSQYGITESPADAFKRVLIYGKPLEEYSGIIKAGLGDFVVGLVAMGFNIAELQEMNSAKLERKRYKNGFSEEAAINRNVDEERQALEEQAKQ